MTMNENTQSGLRLDNIEISLNGAVLLKVNTTIAPSEVLTVMGPSGSGKSTLLAYIGGFLDGAFVATGNIFCGTRNITEAMPQQRRAGLLFQDPLLFPHMSVGGNLMFAMPKEISPKFKRRECAQLALEEVELEGYFDRDPDTLSGGQKARVALARVLISRPAFLLLDEPFSKLDANLRDQMRELVFTNAKMRQLPVLLVTHDRADADAAGGEVIEVGPDPRTNTHQSL